MKNCSARPATPGSLGTLAIVAAFVLQSCGAAGQALEVRGDAGQQLTRSSEASSETSEESAGEVIRAIQDPHSGERWLLMRNDDHPGGPGRLLLANAPERSPGLAVPGTAPRSRAMKLALPGEVVAIRAGDRLVVEEHTAISDVRLEAVALEPAKVGMTLTVRLKIGGREERAVALGPGRAAFAPSRQAAQETRP